MSLQQQPLNWFDFTVIIVLLVGIIRGRKRGLSEELLPMLQWLGMMFAATFLYKPFGQFLVKTPPFDFFDLLFSYILAYSLIVVAVKILFSFIKRSLGGKLIGSDVFGGAEYYIGMIAGMIRFACMIVIALALINARFYNSTEIKAIYKYQKDVYGSDYFPGLNAIQQEIFQKSFIGPHIKQYAGFMLITPTPPQEKILKPKDVALP